VGDALGEAWYHRIFGDLEFEQGHFEQAATQYQASLTQFQALGNRAGMQEASEHLSLAQSKIEI
jgi:hypothetical protein